MGAFARAADRALPARLESLARVVRSEFVEMPAMRLTWAQFRRLWNLQPPEAEHLVAVLVAQEFLVEGPDGRICRRADPM